MKVAFVVNDLQLSGGVGVVVAHARQLVERHGFDVTLILARDQEAPHWDHAALPGLHVAPLEAARSTRFDVAVGTWWETAFSLFTLTADRYAMFVQSLEDRFYHPQQPERAAATLVTDLPVAYLTEARWIADTLAQLRPDAPCHLVRNGIDKAIFTPVDAVPVRLDDEPLKVLVEGNPEVWFKHVGAALNAAALMREPHETTLVSAYPADAGAPVDRRVGPLSHAEMAELYAESDVLLKLSSVEGMFGPPLEAFHRGATCVVTPVTGHDEYVEHGWNGLVCDWDDPRGTARLLDLLARDRELLHFLRHNALRTAQAWPSWEQASELMALALRRVHREPPPPTATAVAQLLADVRAGVEAAGGVLAERNLYAGRVRRFDEVLGRPVVRQVWERRASRPARLLRHWGGRLLAKLRP